MEYLELFKLDNFTLIKKGVGEIKWLEPVDARYLKIQQLVNFEKYQVYLNTDIEGFEALNKPVEITFYDIPKRKNSDILSDEFH